MTKNSNILLIGAALLMLAGCTVDELAGSKDGQIPVRLSVSQEATVTRAADGLYTNTTGFDGTESVEVFVNSSEKHATFTVGTPDGTHKSDLTGTLYYPTTGDANLYAVYPATAATTGSHTVKYDQTTPANYKASDLMYAKTTVAQEDKDDEQNLEFGHQLVKLKVVIAKAADVSQVTQVMMKNVKRQVSVTPGASSMTLGTPATATGVEATGGDNILVSSGESSSTSAQTYTYAVVFPAQEWDDADFITVTADSKTATYKLTKNNFVAGSEYTLTLNINALALDNTVTIGNWTGPSGSCTVQPTILGDIKMNPLWYCSKWYVAEDKTSFDKTASTSQGYLWNWNHVTEYFGEGNGVSRNGYNSPRTAGAIQIEGVDWHLPSQQELVSIVPEFNSTKTVLNQNDNLLYLINDPYTIIIEPACVFGYNANTKSPHSYKSFWSNKSTTERYAIRFLNTNYCSVWRYQILDWNTANARLVISAKLIPSLSDDNTTANIAALTSYLDDIITQTENGTFDWTDNEGTYTISRTFYAAGYGRYDGGLTGEGPASATSKNSWMGMYSSTATSATMAAYMAVRLYLDGANTGVGLPSHNYEYGCVVRLFRDN